MCFYPGDLLLCFLMSLLALLFWFVAANGALLSSSGTPLTLDQRGLGDAAVQPAGSCCRWRLVLRRPAVTTCKRAGNPARARQVCCRPADGRALVCDAELEI